METKVCIVAALSAHDRGIGKDNELLWHIPEDMKRFKRLTVGHPVIMGRKTYESIIDILGKPLPERTNIVVTRDASYTPTFPNVLVAHTLEEALKKAREIDPEEIHIGGGSELYRQALPSVTHLYLTLIDDKKEADTFFPEYEKEFTRETFREERETKKGLNYTWVNLERE